MKAGIGAPKAAIGANPALEAAPKAGIGAQKAGIRPIPATIGAIAGRIGAPTGVGGPWHRGCLLVKRRVMIAPVDGKAPLYRSLMRHLVGIGWIDEPVGGRKGIGEVEAWSVTGFVVAACNHWFLLTAGHVFRDMELRFKSQRKLIRSCFLDGMSLGKPGHPITFSFDGTRKLVMDEREDGIDLGLLVLSPMYVELLKKGGIVPLDASAWAKPDAPVTGFALLGFPKERKSARVTAPPDNPDGIEVRWRVHPPLMSVRPERRPPKVLKKKVPQFYGRIAPKFMTPGGEVALDDIDGMSGGPLFALSRGEKEIKYWLVGVQSVWVKSKRALAATYAGPLMKTLEEEMRARGFG
jgi:hypothetical protein